MIIVRLKGRLGNQMFQYAAGRALALRRGVPLALDNRVYEDRGPCALDVFNIHTVPPPQDRLPPRNKTWAMRILKSNPRTLWTRRERKRPFDPRMLNLPDWSYLQGYFQDERYFADCVDVIRRDFTFRDPPNDENAAWLRRIAGESLPVSVHVRRTDFVGRAAMAPTELHAAMTRLAPRHPTFFIFSDDPDWCRRELPAAFVIANNADAPHEDLRLMAACREHITTPGSSFSFWGKWLAARSSARSAKEMSPA